MTTGAFDNNQQTITLTQAIVVSGSFLSAESSSDMPTAMIRTFAFDNILSSVTLKSEGQLLSISGNEQLYASIGSIYGGDDYKSFNIPDLAGKVEVGSQSSAYSGQVTGESQTTLTEDQLPPALGGVSQSVDNAQPSLSVNYLIRVTSDSSSPGFVGEVDAFAGTTFTISGGQFLVAAGQLLPIAEYPQLYAVIGTTYGGDGLATFALPNLTGRSIIGTSSTLKLGAVVGKQTVSLSNANVPVSDGGSGTSFDNRAPGLALNYIICVSGAYPNAGSDNGPVMGEIRAYAGSAASIPQGWVLANGALLPIAQNQALFSLLGTTYGGNGTTNFALPNLSDTVVAGSGGSQSFGKTYGSNAAILSVSGGACFCGGSRIRTSRGDIPVEEIQIGDHIVAFDDDVTGGTIRSVTWVGQSRAVVRSRLPDDEAGYPVRLLKGAIAHNVPYKEMLITSEHCLFLDGRFVPVRMLVNGRSIFFDRSIASYDYYHVETEDHSVIMADGVLTESYLDTGNRLAFDQNGPVVSIRQSRNLTWDDAAAPLDVSRHFVEPLFRSFQSRADHVEHMGGSQTPLLTYEDGLCLVTETGRLLHPIRKVKDRVMFKIPSGVRSVRILSNASRPCDVIGPFVDDRRMLGVLVGYIEFFEADITTTLISHLQDVDLSGWNNIENGAMRWTNGSALLPLRFRSVESTAIMALQIHSAGPYLVSDSWSGDVTLQVGGSKSR
ncbi:tail fiber protein [Gluconobacter wancherniae]|uniref:tail fiber protein n=1 Tax=Gluconobacter wancherniae TaxID=1307955 RepID=UPI001B8D2E26|nr:tail fiber protein [Gluconobacter wancherniae]MBS1063794.1 tail fiber protein [Gluconobacter wancherniae]